MKFGAAGYQEAPFGVILAVIGIRLDIEGGKAVSVADAAGHLDDGRLLLGLRRGPQQAKWLRHGVALLVALFLLPFVYVFHCSFWPLFASLCSLCLAACFIYKPRVLSLSALAAPLFLSLSLTFSLSVCVDFFSFYLPSIYFWLVKILLPKRIFIYLYFAGLWPMTFPK